MSDTMQADRAHIHAMVEDHWRTMFEQNCTSNDMIDRHEARLRERLIDYGKTLPEAEQWEVVRLAQSISAEFSDECERDARGLRHRLCPSRFPAPAAARVGTTAVVDTLVRASIWQAISALFKR